MTWLSAVIGRALNRVTAALTLDGARVTKKGHPFDETAAVLPVDRKVSTSRHVAIDPYGSARGPCLWNPQVSYGHRHPAVGCWTHVFPDRDLRLGHTSRRTSVFVRARVGITGTRCT